MRCLNFQGLTREGNVVCENTDSMFNNEAVNRSVKYCKKILYVINDYTVK